MFYFVQAGYIFLTKIMSPNFYFPINCTALITFAPHPKGNMRDLLAWFGKIISQMSDKFFSLYLPCLNNSISPTQYNIKLFNIHLGFELWLSDKRVDFLRWLTLQPNTSINIYGFRLPLTYRLSDVEEADFDFPRLSSWNISDTLLSLCCLSISILSTFDLSLSNSSSCSSHLFSSCRALDCAANCAIVKYKAIN